MNYASCLIYPSHRDVDGENKGKLFFITLPEYLPRKKPKFHMPHLYNANLFPRPRKIQNCFSMFRPALFL